MADNYSFKDASGNTQTHASKDVGAGAHASKHVPVDDAGVLIAKAEDAAHSSGDKGYMLLAVRKDTAAALAGADGDYIPLIVDANGRLHITGPVVAGSGATDDAAAAGELYPLAGLYQAAASVDEIDDGDIGRLRITRRRSLITAADHRRIVLTASDPAPTGSDITRRYTALQSDDLAIRDTDLHYILIPLTDRGWKFCSVYITPAVAFDQAATVRLYAWSNATTPDRGLLVSTTLPVGTTGAWFMPRGGAGAGLGEVVGASTIAANMIFTVPALSDTPMHTLALRVSFSVAPTVGELEITVIRST